MNTSTVTALAARLLRRHLTALARHSPNDPGRVAELLEQVDTLEATDDTDGLLAIIGLGVANAERQYPVQLHAWDPS
jgi:hypothetical protein